MYPLTDSLLPHRLKGPSYEAGARLQAASGMHHLMGNLWQVLVRLFMVPTIPHMPNAALQSDTLDKGFEQPLRQDLDAYKTVIHVRKFRSLLPFPIPKAFCCEGLRQSHLLISSGIQTRDLIMLATAAVPSDLYVKRPLLMVPFVT
jgi:hypothetical protein